MNLRTLAAVALLLPVGGWWPAPAAAQPGVSGAAVAPSGADFFSTRPSLAAMGSADLYGVPSGVPAMPPPPGIAPPSVTGGVLPAAATFQPPAVAPPPVAQNFGSTVAPALPAGPPAVAAPAPGFAVADYQQYLRFMQNIRIRHTWLLGDEEPDEFGVNESEGAVTFAFPNFFFSQQPLLVTPGFIFHVWDPPFIPALAAPGFGQLPSQVYSAYLDFYWTPVFGPRLRSELDARIGVYSDFESVGSEAIRPQGYGALIWQWTPTLAIKGGATYINRVDIELLPVFGVIWTPDRCTYFDITFPNPKLSHYAWTWGNTDVWWYVAAEYGGGSWEIDNAGDDRVDLNDIRAIVGLEWTGGWWGTKGFFEAGYVFERELFFEAAPIQSFELKETIMLRGGLAF